MNLLQETLNVLKISGLCPNDVRWVGSGDFYTTWEVFAKIANTEYYEGYGSQEVACDLVIIGDNWWMERTEYDGSEAWDFKTVPLKPTEEIELKALTIDQAVNPEEISCGWETLARINGIMDKE